MRRIDSRDMDGSVKAVQMRKVRQLYAMLDGTSCRPAAVRRYFGESSVTACGQCDLCLNPPEAADATEAAQKALSAVHRLGGRLARGCAPVRCAPSLAPGPRRRAARAALRHLP